MRRLYRLAALSSAALLLSACSLLGGEGEAPGPANGRLGPGSGAAPIAAPGEDLAVLAPEQLQEVLLAAPDLAPGLSPSAADDPAPARPGLALPVQTECLPAPSTAPVAVAARKLSNPAAARSVSVSVLQYQTPEEAASGFRAASAVVSACGDVFSVGPNEYTFASLDVPSLGERTGAYEVTLRVDGLHAGKVYVAYALLGSANVTAVSSGAPGQVDAVDEALRLQVERYRAAAS